MNTEKSEIKWRIMVAFLSMVFLLGQSYIYLTVSFDRVLTPLAEIPQTQSFVRDALLDVWSGMLIWPFMLFMLILSEVLSIWRARRQQ